MLKAISAPCIFAATIFAVCVSAPVKADWVQWTAASGGNDHWYKVFTAPDVIGTGRGISWDDANTAAQAAGGYLVTITSAEEQTFINSLIYRGYYPSYWRKVSWGYFGPWIGAQQSPLPENYGPSYSNTNWSWVTGEAWGYTNWCEQYPATANQPNDGHASYDGDLGGWEEDKVVFAYKSGVPYYWCDIASIDPATYGGAISYIVEIGNVTTPEPSTMTLLLICAASLMFVWRRR